MSNALGEQDKGRSREYLFGPISADDVEWAKSALDVNLQMKRQPTRLSDMDKTSTVASETMMSVVHTPEMCVETGGKSMMDLITNVQELSLKLGAEGRQRESLEQQVAQLREQNRQLMEELDKAKQHQEGNEAYYEALEAVKKLDAKDYGQDCEEIMDAIYTTICDAFGPDNKLALLFEDMADIYLKREAKHEMEVQALQKQIDLLSKFEHVLKGEVQPKSKSLDILIDQLQTTREEASKEIGVLRKKLESVQEECGHLERSKQEMERALEEEREEMATKVSFHQERYQKIMKDQGKLLAQLPILKLSATEEAADEEVLRQTGNTTLEQLITALYRKDAEMQKLIKHKNDILQRQQSEINMLGSRIKEWEADAVLWLDYVNHDGNKKRPTAFTAM
ncbi:hypothetical protein BgAZ_106900 [Babesia gibsoni]|uniref:Uncharacterized protein n=1 Tax=Babesia gibsoni TaxID=33632 RepID=A0AAD8PG84_BABGI|nr:hypothetical protein BgAZ_106900 [Babesia gibsoni]